MSAVWCVVCVPRMFGRILYLGVAVFSVISLSSVFPLPPPAASEGRISFVVGYLALIKIPLHSTHHTERTGARAQHKPRPPKASLVVLYRQEPPNVKNAQK